MKQKLICSIALGSLLLAHFSVVAQEGSSSVNDMRFGVGLMVGEPTGASFKYWLSEESAIDGLLGVSFDDDNNFTAHVDYLYHLNDLVHLDQNRFAVYFGGGPRWKVRDDKDDFFGIRAVAGVAYMFDDMPVDVFFETGPVFDLTPDVEVRYTIGVGARFWF